MSGDIVQATDFLNETVERMLDRVNDTLERIAAALESGRGEPEATCQICQGCGRRFLPERTDTANELSEGLGWVCSEACWEKVAALFDIAKPDAPKWSECPACRERHPVGFTPDGEAHCCGCGAFFDEEPDAPPASAGERVGDPCPACGEPIAFAGCPVCDVVTTAAPPACRQCGGKIISDPMGSGKRICAERCGAPAQAAPPPTQTYGPGAPKVDLGKPAGAGEKSMLDGFTPAPPHGDPEPPHPDLDVRALQRAQERLQGSLRRRHEDMRIANAKLAAAERERDQVGYDLAARYQNEIAQGLRERDEARKERDEAVARAERLSGELEDMTLLCGKNVDLAERYRAAHDFLGTHGEHIKGCAALSTDEWEDCDCGLRAALEPDAALAEGES